MSYHATPVIGIVGGVGSGKSTIADWLSHQLPVAILKADETGHAVLRETDVRRALRAAFGDDIFDDHDQVQRPLLAARVFGDAPEQVAADFDALLQQLVDARQATGADAIRTATAEREAS